MQHSLNSLVIWWPELAKQCQAYIPLYNAVLYNSLSHKSHTWPAITLQLMVVIPRIPFMLHFFPQQLLIAAVTTSNG